MLYQHKAGRLRAIFTEGCVLHKRSIRQQKRPGFNDGLNIDQMCVLNKLFNVSETSSDHLFNRGGNLRR